MTTLPNNIIDFHVHLFPDKLFDAIWKYFSEVYQWDVIYQYYYRECVDYLNKKGVSHVVYSNYAHRKDIAGELNQWNKKILDEIPNLYCFAAFHPEDENAMTIAEDVISHAGILGFKLQFLVQHFYPHDERLFPLYELVLEKKKRILFHVGTGPVGNDYVGYDNFIKVMRRYPDLHANVAHMGGYEYQQFMDLVEEFDNLYLDTSFTFFKSEQSGFDVALEQMEKNQDKIVYGSDFPNLILPREEEPETLLGLGFSEEFYQKLFFDNGMKLIKQHSGSV